MFRSLTTSDSPLNHMNSRQVLLAHFCLRMATASQRIMSSARNRTSPCCVYMWVRSSQTQAPFVVEAMHPGNLRSKRPFHRRATSDAWLPWGQKPVRMKVDILVKHFSSPGRHVGPTFPDFLKRQSNQSYRNAVGDQLWSSDWLCEYLSSIEGDLAPYWAALNAQSVVCCRTQVFALCIQRWVCSPSKCANKLLDRILRALAPERKT